MKKITRLVSWLLLVAMIASMVFTTALAEEDPVAPAEENTEITETAEVPAEQPDEEDETLTVAEPQIIAQPEDMTAYIGETAQFTVGVEGVVSSARWQYSKDGGVNWSFLNASYDGLTLSFTAKEKHNGYQYRAVASFEDGTKLTSDAAEITIVAPRISAQPQDMAAQIGETASFTVDVEGVVSSVRWQYSKNGGETWANLSSSYNGLTLSFTVKASHNGYQYRAVVTCKGSVKLTSEAAALTVIAPRISEQPQDMTAYAGETAQFTVGVADGAVSSVRWQYSRNGGAKWSNLSESYADQTLSFTVKESHNGYQYRAVVTFDNGVKLTSEAAALTVAAARIISQPQDAQLPVGASARFTVGVEGVVSSARWQYSKDGGGKWSYLNASYDGLTLAFTVKELHNGYQYRAVVTFKDGTKLTSEAATLTLADLAEYPALQGEETIELDGVSATVAVDAPAGALPAGAALALSSVEDVGAAKTRAENGLGIGLTDLVALDIGFGDNVEPVKPVTVSVTAEGLSRFENPVLIHIPDAGEPEIIKDAVFEGDTVTFTHDDFSIYIAGEKLRLNYKFYKGTELIASEFACVGTDLYRPDITSDYGKTFLGWAYEPNVDPDDTTGKIKQIDDLQNDFASVASRTDLQDLDGDNINDVNIYAVFHDAYYLRYMTMENNTETILRTVYFRTDTSVAVRTFEVWDGREGDISYLTGDNPHWVDVEHGRTYDPHDSITLNQHIDLYASVEGSHWLLFDKNISETATYTPPQYLVGNATTTKPAIDPVCIGYSFVGWNTAAEGTGTWWYKADGSVNRFGGSLTGDVKLYARWEPDETSFTVVFWKQKVTDEANLNNSAKTYDYVRSETRSGMTGQTASLDNNDKRQNTLDSEGRFQYTTYNSAKSDASAVIKADGTTILNVYYDRNAYTLSFQEYDYTYTVSTGDNDNSPAKYGDVNGGKGRVYWRNGAFRTTDRNNGPVYNGTVYTRSNNQNWNTIKTITALVGHDIHAEFPIVGADGTTYTAARWDPQSNSLGWNEVMSYIEVMPHANVTFHLDTNNRPTKTVHYYVEALTGGTAAPATLYSPENNSVVSAGDKRFVLYNSVEYKYNGVTIEDVIDLEGFTRLGMDSQYQTINTGSNWNPVYTNFWIYDTSSDGTLNIYYTRNSYELHFISQGENTIPPISDEKRYVLYEDDLSRFGQDENGDWLYEPTNGKEGYFFTGWYWNPECTERFEFDQETMPSHNLQLYAKWETYRIRVVLFPTADNAHNNEVTFANPQALKFRLDYNEKIAGSNIKTAARPGYSLNNQENTSGWYYKDENGAFQPYEFDQPVNKDSDGVDMDYQHSADWHRYGDDDGEHLNVRGILKLYALWTLDSSNVHVVYEVPKGYCILDADGSNLTVVPVDPINYTRGESYDVRLEDEIPKNFINGFRFVEWVLLNTDGTESETTGVPGDELNGIASSYVKEEDVTDDNGNSGKRRTITFRAVFEAAGANATEIRYNGNGGFAANGSITIKQPMQINADTDLLGEDAFTMDGYTLIGWSRDPATTQEAFEDAVALQVTAPEGFAIDYATLTQSEDVTIDYAELESAGYFLFGETVAADNVNVIISEDDYSANTLYAVWAANFYVYHSGVAGGAIEAIPMTRANATYDLTQHLGGAGVIRDGEPADVLYGGYYLAEDDGIVFPEKVDGQYPAYDGANWTWNTPETVNGMKMTPQAGKTYYIKEVPASKYLQPYFHYTYEYTSGDICTAWVISDLDDNQYFDSGFVISDESAETLNFLQTEGRAESLTIEAQNSGNTITLRPTGIFAKKGVKRGLLTYQKVFDEKAEIESREFIGKLVYQYWVTMDGLRVTGTAARTYTSVTTREEMTADCVINSTRSSTIEVYTP